MNKPEFQQRVDRFVVEYDLETDVPFRLLDLLSELGEVAKEALKGSRYGSTGFNPTQNWEPELADAFFSLICIANTTGVNLDSALDLALEKYRLRLSSTGDAGSGR